MLARQEAYADHDEAQADGINHTETLTAEEERELLRETPKEPFFTTVLNRPLRSHCQTLFLVVAALAMLVTVCSGISASRGYALIEVQREADRIEQENERLAIEIAKLKNPQRIKSIAETELGMSVPKKTYFSHEEK